MVDEAQSVPRARVGKVWGRLDAAAVLAANRALAVFLGVA